MARGVASASAEVMICTDEGDGESFFSILVEPLMLMFG
jgi:hypothetical protein